MRQVIYETCTGVRAFADNREGGQKLVRSSPSLTWSNDDFLPLSKTPDRRDRWSVVFLPIDRNSVVNEIAQVRTKISHC